LLRRLVLRCDLYSIWLFAVHHAWYMRKRARQWVSHICARAPRAEHARFLMLTLLVMHSLLVMCIHCSVALQRSRVCALPALYFTPLYFIE